MKFVPRGTDWPIPGSLRGRGRVLSGFVDFDRTSTTKRSDFFTRVDSHSDPLWSLTPLSSRALLFSKATPTYAATKNQCQVCTRVGAHWAPPPPLTVCDLCAAFWQTTLMHATSPPWPPCSLTLLMPFEMPFQNSNPNCFGRGLVQQVCVWLLCADLGSGIWTWDLGPRLWAWGLVDLASVSGLLCQLCFLSSIWARPEGTLQGVVSEAVASSVGEVQSWTDWDLVWTGPNPVVLVWVWDFLKNPRLFGLWSGQSHMGQDGPDLVWTRTTYLILQCF